MPEDHGPCKLVTEMPEITIESGFMYFRVRSGGESNCEAYPINLIVQINRLVDELLVGHFKSMGEVVPLDRDAGH